MAALKIFHKVRSELKGIAGLGRLAIGRPGSR